MSRTIDYGNLMHDAMRGLIREVLGQISKDGLPGEHHFFIKFDTMHPDVELADWLSDRYPEEMTIVIQNWFRDLAVDEDGFAITLNFGDSPESLYVPFDAIRTFVDPSVEFGLKFETQEFDDDPNGEPQTEPAADPETPDGQPADIVSLDSFRKR